MDLSISTGLGHGIFLTVGYALIGGLIKYIDQAFDIEVFNKKVATFMAIPTAILMASLMAYNESSATIFFAIVLGLALTRKIDNIAFQTGLFFLLTIPIFFGEYVKVQWLPFAFLFTACIGDEYTNDWSDQKAKKRNIDQALGVKNHTSLKQQILETLFQHRVLMKLAVIILVLIGSFKPIYIITFFAFDIAYKTVEIYSFKIKRYGLDPASQPNHKTVAV